MSMKLREQVRTAEDGDELSTSSHHETTGAVANDDANSDLSMIQAATLLTADCVGVGILALPKDVQELGWIIGLGLLLLNLPINYYAGKILAVTATHVEQQGGGSHHNKDGIVTASTMAARTSSSDFEMVATSEEGDATTDRVMRERNGTRAENDVHEGTLKQVPVGEHATEQHQQGDDEVVGVASHEVVSTQDFIGLTGAIFASAPWSGLVTTLYFCNLFLVLGDYILVMSYAVAAMLGDNICLPWAGVLASILMFAVSQLRTMASLGREASIISLACLFVVLVQCLVSTEEHAAPAKTARTSVVGDSMVLRKFSALASIGFAIGSQKLFLNIRHEMRHKQEAPTTLMYSLGTFGTAYVVTCILAGPGTCI